MINIQNTPKCLLDIILASFDCTEFFRQNLTPGKIAIGENIKQKSQLREDSLKRKRKFLSAKNSKFQGKSQLSVNIGYWKVPPIGYFKIQG